MTPKPDRPADLGMQAPNPTAWLPRPERLRFWAERIGHFGFWQLASQALQLITGFLLVQWLSIEAYAQFGVALSFQNMLGLLVDLGFSSAIIALVGDRIHDREVVGRHVRSARSFRNKMLLTVGPLSALGFFWLARSHQWPFVSSLLIFFSILGLLFFQGWTACYSPPLLMHLQIAPLFRPGVMLGTAKLAACAAFHFAAVLGATAVCWFNTLAALATALIYRSHARPYLVEPSIPDPETNRAIRNYIAPLIPGIAFQAFQGQIQVLLISTFGGNQSIAEVTALGRLSQLFVFLSSFNGVIVTPYIARVPNAHLALRYFQAISLTVLVGAVLTGSAYLFPGIFLSLLGSKYHGLGAELGFSMLAASLAFINFTLYGLNNARRWIFHWTSTVNILGLIAIQAVLIATMSLTTTLNVMIFSAITGLYPILVFVMTAIYGYRKDQEVIRPTEAS